MLRRLVGLLTIDLQRAAAIAGLVSIPLAILTALISREFRESAITPVMLPRWLYWCGVLLSLVGLARPTFYLFGATRFARRLRTAEQVKTQVPLPLLGVLPFVKSRDGSSLDDSVEYREAMRRLRTNLLFSLVASPVDDRAAPAKTVGPTSDGVDEVTVFLKDGTVARLFPAPRGGSSQSSVGDMTGARVLAITSGAPGEGKTMIAVQLARALAQFGETVLLIDADMRRPRCHDILGRAQEPGLSNVLVGISLPEDAIVKTDQDNLYLLSAGHAPPNPVDLLGSRHFSVLRASLQNKFDWIIFDTPPILSVIDSALVSAQSSGTLVVIGAGSATTGHRARLALEQLASARGNVLGTVLNSVSLSRDESILYSTYVRNG